MRRKRFACWTWAADAALRRSGSRIGRGRPSSGRTCAPTDFEPPRAALRRCAEEAGRPVQVEFRRGNLFEMAEKESFDAVWMQQTFHHIEPRTEAV